MSDIYHRPALRQKFPVFPSCLLVAPYSQSHHILNPLHPEVSWGPSILIFIKHHKAISRALWGKHLRGGVGRGRGRVGFLIKPPFIPSSFSLGLLAEISSQFSGSKEILSGERGPAFKGKGSQRLSPFKHVDRAVWLREVLDIQ